MTWTMKLDFVNAPDLSDLATTNFFAASSLLADQPVFEPIELDTDTFIFDIGASDGSISAFGSGAASASFSGSASGNGVSSVSGSLSAFANQNGASGASLEVPAIGDAVDGFGSVATNTDFDTLILGGADLQASAPVWEPSVVDIDLSMESLALVSFDQDMLF